MITRISSILAAAVILGSASIASAAAVHKPVKHYYQHRPAIMLLEDNPASIAASQAEANTEAAERFQSQFDNSY